MTAAGVIVVDAANVVGSRPDGWWRDRAGAARRLHERLVGADLQGVGQVVLVLEGAASAGVELGAAGVVRVVHAAGSGDDTVVAVVAELSLRTPDGDVTVVTGDRDLRRRVAAHGAGSVGPGWLWSQLS